MFVFSLLCLSFAVVSSQLCLFVSQFAERHLLSVMRLMMLHSRFAPRISSKRVKGHLET